MCFYGLSLIEIPQDQSQILESNALFIYFMTIHCDWEDKGSL
jgi:hypothetical protein